MEENINIADILKDKPYGISLYSSVFGSCVYRDNCDNCIEVVTNNCYYFNEKGHYITNGVKSENGECLLFPSNEMRDWSKFAWKKGDVLVSRDKNMHLIFEKFTDDTYTIFAGKHCYEKDFRNEYNYERRFDSFMTEYFTLETDDADVQTYIRTIENNLGGKLNLETLEIDKHQPEFKDGDIVVYGKSVAICRRIYNNTLYFYVSIDETFGLLFDDNRVAEECRFATDEDKQQLFEALAKENKAWDAEKKAIVDLKPLWTPKPFDRVVTRVDDDAIWTANIFSHIDSYGEYNTIGCVGGYPYCLPYNEETAKLIGTTNNWEG